jgi:hypothetical protein
VPSDELVASLAPSGEKAISRNLPQVSGQRVELASRPRLPHLELSLERTGGQTPAIGTERERGDLLLPHPRDDPSVIDGPDEDVVPLLAGDEFPVGAEVDGAAP